MLILYVTSDTTLDDDSTKSLQRVNMQRPQTTAPMRHSLRAKIGIDPIG